MTDFSKWVSSCGFFSLQKTFLAYAYLRLENKRWNSKSALTYIGCSCLSVHNIRPKESKLIKILTVNEAYIASYPQVFEMQSSFGNKSQEKRRLSLFSSVYNHHQPPNPPIYIPTLLIISQWKEKQRPYASYSIDTPPNHTYSQSTLISEENWPGLDFSLKTYVLHRIPLPKKNLPGPGQITVSLYRKMKSLIHVFRNDQKSTSQN